MIVKYRYARRECCLCGEPAMHRMTFLLENARRNPASSAYRGDDISYRSDAQAFACNFHKEDVRRNVPSGMKWCSNFYVSVGEDGTEKNVDRVCYWETVNTDYKTAKDDHAAA